MRKNYDKGFKSKIAIEAIRGEKTIQEISIAYEIHPNLVSNWKAQLLEGAETIFERSSEGNTGVEIEAEKKQDELYRQVGKLQVENDFLKKKYRQLYGSEPAL